MIYQTVMPIHNLPIQLVLLSDGRVALVPTQPLGTRVIICDFSTKEGNEIVEKFYVTITQEGVTISERNAEEVYEIVYRYNTAFILNDSGMLKKWLIKEQLEAPWA